MTADHDHLIKEWVEKAQGFLPRKLSVRKNMRDPFHIISYTHKEWSVFYTDLRQLATDLGIFKEMYPDEKAPEFDISFPQPVPAQTPSEPFPVFITFNSSDKWALVFNGTEIELSDKQTAKCLGAGMEFKDCLKPAPKSLIDAANEWCSANTEAGDTWTVTKEEGGRVGLRLNDGKKIIISKIEDLQDLK